MTAEGVHNGILVLVGLFLAAIALTIVVELVRNHRASKYRIAYDTWLQEAINSEDPRRVREAITRQHKLSSLQFDSKEYFCVLERWWREDRSGDRRPGLKDSRKAAWGGREY